MLLPIAFLLCLTATYVSGQGVCTLEDDKIVTSCLKTVSATWQRFQLEKSQLRSVIFNLYNYERSELLTMCDAFNEAKLNCLADDLVQRCRKLPMITFVQSVLSYACEQKTGAKLFEHFNCIKESLNTNSHCYDLIRAANLHPGHREKCKNFQTFFDCAGFEAQLNCGPAAKQVLKDSIVSFGCEVDKGICTPDKQSDVAVCLSPVISKWQQVLDGRKLKFSFPLFALNTSDLDSLCFGYHNAMDDCYTGELRKRCGKNALVRFVESNLGYACRTDNPAFFHTFMCISEVFNTADECRDAVRGVSLPGQDSNKCVPMRKFYLCMRNRVETKCKTSTPSEALTVLEEAIDNFECGDSLKAPVKPGDVCNNEMDPGPCDSIFVRAFYNRNRNTCETFVYGGCGGNANNFGSVTECEEACGETILKARTQAFLRRTSPIDTSVKTGHAVNVSDVIRKLEEIENTGRKTNTQVSPQSPNILAISDTAKGGVDTIDTAEEDSHFRVQQKQTDPDVFDPLDAFTTETLPETEEPEVIEESPKSLEEMMDHIFTPAPPRTGIDPSAPAINRPVPTISATGVTNCPPVSKCSSPSCIIITGRNGCQKCICETPTTQTPSRIKTTPRRPILDVPKVSAKCRFEDQQELKDCVKPLILNWQNIARQRGDLDRIIFGIFKYEAKDYTSLCPDYKWLHKQCYTQRLLANCAGHPFISFIESYLSYPCGDDKKEFLAQFDCIHNVTIRSDQCLQLLDGVYYPGREHFKCTLMPTYYNCMARNVADKCGTEGLMVFSDAIQNFGCALPKPHVEQVKTPPVEIEPTLPTPTTTAATPATKRTKTNQSKTTTKTDLPPVRNPIAIAQPSGSPPGVSPQSFISSGSSNPLERLVPQAIRPFGPNGPVIQAVFVPDELLANETFRQNLLKNFQPQIPPLLVQGSSNEEATKLASGFIREQLGQQNNQITRAPPAPITTTTAAPLATCSEPVKRRVQNCFSPLFNVLNTLARQRSQEFSNLVFPLYTYTKAQVLDLCDNYASAFISCNPDAIRGCQQDELVQFAITNLGFACGQNVVQFHQHFNCISVVVKNSPVCLEAIKGPFAPGNESFKCSGMRQFYRCLKSTVLQSCPIEGLNVLQQTITSFGCEFQ